MVHRRGLHVLALYLMALGFRESTFSVVAPFGYSTLITSRSAAHRVRECLTSGLFWNSVIRRRGHYTLHSEGGESPRTHHEKHHSGLNPLAQWRTPFTKKTTHTPPQK